MAYGGNTIRLRDTLPDKKIMTTIVTKPSRIKRQEAYDLYERRINAAMEDKNDAMRQGDLRENFGYHAAKDSLANLRQMQAELGLHDPLIHMVDPMEWEHLDMEGFPRAMVGAIVSFTRDGKPEEKLLGGAWDGEFENEQVIAYNSPLGKTLIRTQIGKKSVLETSGETIEVTGARPPTARELEAIYPAPEKEVGKAQKKVKDEMLMN